MQCNRDTQRARLCCLPSGTLWASCNIGAIKPKSFGDYFAWGETETKEIYNWDTYKYYESCEVLTKYCNDPEKGLNGFSDELTMLQPADDAATAKWGEGWRTPTSDEMQELIDNCTHKLTTKNGVYGCLFTSSNGNSLFLPAAGYRFDVDLPVINRTYGQVKSANADGCYWTSSLYTDNPNKALKLSFNSESFEIDYDGRDDGYPIRPVCSIKNNPTEQTNNKQTEENVENE